MKPKTKINIWCIKHPYKINLLFRELFHFSNLCKIMFNSLILVEAENIIALN